MLVLSRKVGEEILIGDNVRVVIVDVVGDKVKVGVDAPADVEVDRKEVRLSKQSHPRNGGQSDAPQPQVP